MKKKKISKMLSLNKENIVSLNKSQMNQAQGGDDEDLTSVWGCNSNTWTRNGDACCQIQVSCSPRLWTECYPD